MRVTVLYVLCPTADIDISLVTVGHRAVEFTLFGPPVAGLLGIYTVLSIPLIVTVSFSSFNSYSSFSSFNSFNFTSGGLDQGF